MANAGLSDQDMKLVLTEVDFKKEEEVYGKAKLGLAKYIKSEGTATNPAIKVEPVLMAQLWWPPDGQNQSAMDATEAEEVVAHPTEAQLLTKVQPELKRALAQKHHQL